MEEKLIMVFHWVSKNQEFDIEVPDSLTANELVMALKSASQLGIDEKNITQCYLKATNPIALLKGNKTLRAYGLRHGTDIWFDR